MRSLPEMPSNQILILILSLITILAAYFYHQDVPISLSAFIKSPSKMVSFKPISLYTLGTPNGVKLQIMVEELKAAYNAKTGFDYKPITINIGANPPPQKEPWFLAINPNGRIPAIVDHNRNDFKVFESSAEIMYLQRHYDKDNLFSWDPSTDEGSDFVSEVEQWIAFTHGGVGPMQGQAGHFSAFAPIKVEYGIKRYVEETKRLYNVLELRLKDRDYLVGSGRGKYSIADIYSFPWVFGGPTVGIKKSDMPPGVSAWLDRIAARPQVQAGLGDNPRYKALLAGEDIGLPKWQQED